MISVYCAVRAGSLNKAVCALYLKGQMDGDIRCLGEIRYGHRILSGKPEENEFLLKSVRAQ